MTLNYTSPIFLTIIVLVLQGERLRTLGFLAIVCGFLGVLMLLRPSFESGNWAGELIGLGSGFFAGIAIYCTRQLGKMGESSARIVFYYMLICCICSSVWMVIGSVGEISAQGVLWILGMALFGRGGQLAMTRAYSISKSVAVSGLAYSAVIFTCAFGVLFWRESLDEMAWWGIALIVLGGIIAAKSNHGQSSLEPSES